jgi:ubiquinone/menaquinone biosynthesis C-methylase UbiE
MFVVANAEKLPFEKNTFNCVISNLCIQQVSNYKNVLKELERITIEKGLIALYTWGSKEKSHFYSYRFDWVQDKFNIPSYAQDLYGFFDNEESVKNTINDCGLKLITFFENKINLKLFNYDDLLLRSGEIKDFPQVCELLENDKEKIENVNSEFKKYFEENYLNNNLLANMQCKLAVLVK